MRAEVSVFGRCFVRLRVIAELAEHLGVEESPGV